MISMLDGEAKATILFCSPQTANPRFEHVCATTAWKVTVVDFGLATAEGTLLDGGTQTCLGLYLELSAVRV